MSNARESEAIVYGSFWWQSAAQYHHHLLRTVSVERWSKAHVEGDRPPSPLLAANLGAQPHQGNALGK